MSYLSEVIKHAKCGRTYTICATRDEFWDVWNASGRGLTQGVLVSQSLHASDALEFRVFSVEIDDDGYSGDVVQVAVSLAGICAVFYVFIGWCFA